MKTLRAALVTALIVTATGISAVTMQPSAVSACSCPECDVVTDAPVIVSGRVESWHESDIPALGSFTTIIARVRVDRVFKGAAPDTLQVVDLASLSKSPPGWFGASGACGNFDEDPVGKYLIIGLEPYEADGTLVRSNRIWLLYIGDELEGEWYERAQARLAPLGPPSPPSAGNSAGSAPGIAPALGVALLACSAIFSAFAIARRR